VPRSCGEIRAGATNNGILSDTDQIFCFRFPFSIYERSSQRSRQKPKATRAPSPSPSHRAGKSSRIHSQSPAFFKVHVAAKARQTTKPSELVRLVASSIHRETKETIRLEA
jgi:hypothetical protein